MTLIEDSPSLAEYREYFTTLRGQERAVDLLVRAVAWDRLAPAYLFYGVAGIGKRLAAESFAMAICCSRIAIADRPPIRQKILGGNHPDILTIEPTYSDRGKLLSAAEAAAAGVKKKTPPQIRVEQIRAIAEFVSRPPLLGKRSIAIVEAAHTMTESAANALLKTLEEPGKATIILLAENQDSLLPTIISRCQRIPFDRLSTRLTAEVLIANDRGDIAADKTIVALSQGSPGMAIAADERLKSIPKELLENLDAGIKTNRQALEIAKEIDRDLDGECQLFLIDYLQQTSWQSHPNIQRIEDLERARKMLLSYVQPRLVWECTLLSQLTNDR
jgi:DNA polymerase III subunit delta'